jgi:leucyl/phenylalanyl-tRNA--protein transferase
MEQHPQGPYWLDPNDPQAPFPPVDQALREPDGLLAVGGDLSPQRLLNAYAQGIFPWYSSGQPILWWSPDPRLVLFPEQLHIPRSLRKTIRKQPYRITLDQAFERVIDACAAVPRPGQDGTWITPEIRRAYLRLHTLGFAHSVELFSANPCLPDGRMPPRSPLSI